MIIPVIMIMGHGDDNYDDGCIIMMIVMIITIGMMMTMLLMIMTASFGVGYHHLLGFVTASLKVDFI